MMLTRLLQEDFVKWKGSLFYRFLVAVVDDSLDVQQFGSQIPSFFHFLSFQFIHHLFFFVFWISTILSHQLAPNKTPSHVLLAFH
jgi:condensin-2 complex subunit D3